MALRAVGIGGQGQVMWAPVENRKNKKAIKWKKMKIWRKMKESQRPLKIWRKTRENQSPLTKIHGHERQ